MNKYLLIIILLSFLTNPLIGDSENKTLNTIFRNIEINKNNGSMEIPFEYVFSSIINQYPCKEIENYVLKLLNENKNNKIIINRILGQSYEVLGAETIKFMEINIKKDDIDFQIFWRSTVPDIKAKLDLIDAISTVKPKDKIEDIIINRIKNYAASEYFDEWNDENNFKDDFIKFKDLELKVGEKIIKVKCFLNNLMDYDDRLYDIMLVGYGIRIYKYHLVFETFVRNIINDETIKKTNNKNKSTVELEPNKDNRPQFPSDKAGAAPKKKQEDNK